MTTTSTDISAETDDGAMTVVVIDPAAPSSSRRSANTVLLFIDAPGLRPATRQFGERLAGSGYQVIIPDLHHRHGDLLYFEPSDAGDPDTAVTIRSWIASMTDDQIQHDADCALAAAGVNEAEPLAAIGFCLGARAVYRFMTRYPSRVLAGAGWHPSFLVDEGSDSPHVDAATLDRPLYLGIGEADQIQSVEMLTPFIDAAAENDNIEVMVFAGADHGFTWPGYPKYNETAAETSWQKTLQLFDAAFQAETESESDG